MKIAVLSDIHSNHIALETCISYIQKRNIKNFLFLGDYVSDCPYPSKTMKLIYELIDNYNCLLIKGNREEYLLNHMYNNNTWKYSSSTGTLLYTYENLTLKDFNFFKSLAIHGQFSNYGYKAFNYCHGSLTSSHEKLLSNTLFTQKILSELKTDMLICGHTHEQGTYEYAGKKLINPGSVGIPSHHNAKAQFAILHGNKYGWEEEYIRLDYDKASVINEFEKSKLNKKAKVWSRLSRYNILTGIDYGENCVNLAKKLHHRKNIDSVLSDIPEKCWEKAANILGIPE
ncbi:metallophosphoesterase family protein [Clostridium felsineum]|uniref:Uncharacterized protein n=1 Tax=Clostridium felsineum TaxID=36839 RepID=A0A1S8LRD8_9CLOT|nr:metallophosphoesterase family protein [Clostridium felsineum]URZ05809.1 hypothetical protein CLROS_011400 [Clostridium felsineum]URZ10848.1 hypothetical protein CROST_015630 [Clostridium felsineum]